MPGHLLLVNHVFIHVAFWSTFPVSTSPQNQVVKFPRFQARLELLSLNLLMASRPPTGCGCNSRTLFCWLKSDKSVASETNQFILRRRKCQTEVNKTMFKSTCPTLYSSSTSEYRGNRLIGSADQQGQFIAALRLTRGERGYGRLALRKSKRNKREIL